ncbi:MAG TPA: autotransporter-associated beta strand repeat-containing protein [Verrucomicrobiota bacterium]|nr:autotransporter-associated beta strand repeat-containing protein [Verrucomicrobiota bacterium]
MTQSSFLRPTVRGLVSALAVTALSSFVAQATPYASQVTKSGDTVTFVLNQAAQGMVVLRDGANPVTPTPGPATPGVQTFDMTGYTTYSIIVTGSAAKAWTQFVPDGTDRNFWFPNSVSINRNPSSPHFGKVYICNNHRATGGATTAGRVTQDAIYVLRADGTAFSGPHDGGRGNAWMTGDGTAYSRFMKVNVNQDDNLLYAASLWDDQVWGFNDDLSVATQLTDDTNLGNPIGNANSAAFIESVCAMGSRANGDLRLFTANGNYWDASRRGVISYFLGANAAATPSDIGVQVVGPGGLSAYHVSDLEVDSNTNIYTCVYRSTAGQAPDAKKFICSNPAAWPNTTPAWNSTRTDSYIRCVAANEALGLVAAARYASSSGQVYFFDINTGANAGSVDIGDVCRDICFDAAGNMVSVDNSLEYARFWSPGGFTIATTTSAGTFDLIQWDNFSVSAATDPAASEEGPDTATFTISRAGGQNLDVQVNYTMGGTAVSNVDYTISPQSPFTLPADQTSIDITVTPINDGEREPVETVVLTVAAGAYNVVSPSSATATIADNDATVRYWDANGTTAGGAVDINGAAPGTWGVDNFWNDTADGTGAGTTAWTPWAAAVFSAGTDAGSVFSVTNSGTQLVDYLNFEEGIVTVEGGSLTLTNYEAVKVYDRALITSVLDGAAGLAVEGPGTLVLGGANTYTGPTRITAGNLAVGAAGGVIPDGSTVTIGAEASLTLNDQLFSGGTYDETIGGLAGSALAGSGSYNLNVPAGYTLTFGGNNANTTFNGTESGGGTMVKVGTGTMSMTGGVISDTLAISNGVVSINASARLGTANDIIVDGGTLRNSNNGAVAFAPYTRSIFLGASGGVLEVSDAAGILFYGDAASAGTLQGGTLIKDGPGELRVLGLAMANSSFEKLVVRGGLYRGGYAEPTQDEHFLGAIPGSFLPDQVTIENGATLDHSLFMLAVSPNRGVVLGTGGGRLGNLGSMEWPGVISGTQLIKTGVAMLVLGGVNTYTGGTILSGGSLYVTNTAGSGTGSGAVTVTGATLGGEGIIAGQVVMTGGTLTPGYSYTPTANSPTLRSKPVAKLVLGGGLDTTAGATTVNWQLGAPSEANPGTDFDQVDVTGGNLALGSGATLAVSFTGTATAPDFSAFWQTSRSWQVIKFSGGGSISGNFSAITGVAGAVGGTFTTTQDANGVNLVWTSTYVTPQPITDMSIGPVTAGSASISYSGAIGNRFVLVSSPNAEAPLSGWTRVATNFTASGSFPIPVGSAVKEFFAIKSE